MIRRGWPGVSRFDSSTIIARPSSHPASLCIGKRFDDCLLQAYRMMIIRIAAFRGYNPRHRDRNGNNKTRPEHGNLPITVAARRYNRQSLVYVRLRRVESSGGRKRGAGLTFPIRAPIFGSLRPIRDEGSISKTDFLAIWDRESSDSGGNET